MLLVVILSTFFTVQYAYTSPHSPVQRWLLAADPTPLTFMIGLRLENGEDTLLANLKSKRSVGHRFDKKPKSMVAEVMRLIENSRRRRRKRTSDNGAGARRNIVNNGFGSGIQVPKELHSKPNLKYHHQRRHSNGSVSGSYAQMDSSGQLKVTHYVNDDKGFREYPESIVDPYQPYASKNIDVVASSNTGIIQPDLDRHNRINGINHVDATTPSLLPNIDPSPPPPPPYLFDNNIPPTPTFRQYYPKSPLFDKYYRPTPEEVQRVNELNRPRSASNPIALPPVDVTPSPDAQRDKQSELRSVYQEYQLPYTASGTHPVDGRYVTQVPVTSGLGVNGLIQGQTQHDPYLRPVPYQYPHPQTLEPQTPIYLQSYDGQAFLPASTYGGPHLPNTATFNQPYPTNVPIYNTQLPQNVPTFSQAPPENIPVYGQPPIPGHGPNVYYATAASASRSQPTIVAQ